MGANEQLEAPLVVLMAPLDPERVRRFAAGTTVERVDQFVVAIDDAGLSNRQDYSAPDPQAALASSMTLARPSFASSAAAARTLSSWVKRST